MNTIRLQGQNPHARRPSLACVVLAFLACLSLPAFAQDATEADPSDADVEVIREMHRKLMQAYAAMDVDNLAGLLDPSTDLLIFHPRGDLRFSSLPSVRWGLERMIHRVGPSTWSHESQNKVTVVGDVAWHTYNVTIEWSNVTGPLRVRGTEIWVRHAAGWRLTHAHWSERQDGEEMGDGTGGESEPVELPEGG